MSRPAGCLTAVYLAPATGARLSRDEARRLLATADGTTGLMLALMYGTGLRLMECVRLRVKDVDFDRRVVMVRDGKGGKD